jgi:hypothetical protein
MAPKKATQAQRNELKAAAREAASTGSLTQKQVNQLTNAGVNTANIRSIQQTNKAAPAPAQTPAPAQNLSSFINTSAGGTAGTLGLSAVQQALSSGISQKDLTSQAQSQGLSFGPGAQSFLNQQPASQSTSSVQTKGPFAPGVSSIPSTPGLSYEGALSAGRAKESNEGTLGQALRIAGADQNISRSELQKLTKNFGVDASQVVRRIDKINTKSRDRGRALKIGLSQGALQSLINAGTTYTSGMFRESQLGEGRIGRTVQDYINASNPTGGYQNPLSGYSTFKPVRNDRDRAAAQMAAGLMPLQRGGGMQINSKGGLTIKPGVLTKAATLDTTKPLDTIKQEIEPKDLGGGTANGGGGSDTVTTGTGTETATATSTPESIIEQMNQEADTEAQNFNAFTAGNSGTWRTRGRKGGKKGLKTTRTNNVSSRLMPSTNTLRV